jgi:hypothetical protein
MANETLIDSVEDKRTLKDIVDPYLPRKKHILPILEMITGISSAGEEGRKGDIIDLAFSLPVLGAAGSVAKKPLKKGVSYLRKLIHIKRQGVDMTRFFHELPWEKGGQNLWGKLESLNPKILTGGKDLTDDAISAGKRKWVNTNLNLSSKDVIVQTKKELFASPNSLLIDDLARNVSRFRKAGGNAILHRNDKQTIKKLNKLIKKNPKLQIYVDLDGVLVDLKGGLNKF